MAEESYWPEVKKAAGEVRDFLGLPPNFFKELLSQNDWAFVVQLHALLETALTSLIQASCDALPISAFVGSLDFSGGRSSKVQLASLLDLLEPEDGKFLKALSFVRNRLAHNIKNVGFEFSAYAAGLSDERKWEFFRDLCFIYYEETVPKPDREKMLGDIIASPRKYVWSTAIFVLGSIGMRLSIMRTESNLEKLKRERLHVELDLLRKLLHQA